MGPLFSPPWIPFTKFFLHRPLRNRFHSPNMLQILLSHQHLFIPYQSEAHDAVTRKLLESRCIRFWICRDKAPQTGWLQTDTHCLTVLEARRPRWRQGRSKGGRAPGFSPSFRWPQQCSVLGAVAASLTLCLCVHRGRFPLCLYISESVSKFIFSYKNTIFALENILIQYHLIFTGFHLQRPLFIYLLVF